MSENTIGITVKADDKTRAGLDSATKSAHLLKGSLKEVGKVAAGVLTADLTARAGAAFGRFVGDAMKQAGALNESMNAVSLTFKENSAEVIEWGRKNSAAYGLSRQAFQELATPLGAMLKNAGLSMQDTTKWTIDLTKRASDMASVFNVDVDEALTAIQAGLRGESDPLERFGVGLSAAKVEAAALAATGKTTASALTDQEKATARLNMIMQQTSQTAGDFANTSGGAANAARIASAEWDNAKASLGQGLLPIMAKGAQVLSRVAAGFNDLPGPMQTSVVIAGTLGTAFVVLAGKIREVRGELDALAGRTIKAEGVIGGLSRATLRVSAALTAMQFASMAFGDRAADGVNTATKKMEDYAAGIVTSKKEVEDLQWALGGLNDEEWYNKAGKGVMTFTEAISGLGGVIDKSVENADKKIASVDAALAHMVSSGNAEQAAKAFAKLTEDAAKQGVSVERLKEAFPQYADALQAATNETEKASKETKKLEVSLKDLNEQARKNAEGILSQREAMRNVQESIDDVQESIKENGRTLDIHTEKGRANQEALDGLVTAAYDARDAILAQKGSQAAANREIEKGAENFIAAAIAMKMPKEEAIRLARELFKIPANVESTVTVNTTGARKALDALIMRLAYVNGRVQEIQVEASAANVREDRRAKVQRKATGGIVGTAATGGIKSNTVLVGEYGPELVNLAPGSSVMSNPDTSAAYEGLTAYQRSLNHRRHQAHLNHMAILDRDPGPVTSVTGGIIGSSDALIPKSTRRSSSSSSSSYGSGTSYRSGSSNGVPLVRLEIVSGGSKLDDFLVELISRAVRVRGGNVQLVLGGKKA